MSPPRSLRRARADLGEHGATDGGDRHVRRAPSPKAVAQPGGRLGFLDGDRATTRCIGRPPRDAGIDRRGVPGAHAGATSPRTPPSSAPLQPARPGRRRAPPTTAWRAVPVLVVGSGSRAGRIRPSGWPVGPKARKDRLVVARRRRLAGSPGRAAQHRPLRRLRRDRATGTDRSASCGARDGFRVVINADALARRCAGRSRTSDAALPAYGRSPATSTGSARSRRPSPGSRRDRQRRVRRGRPAAG